jgi:hypothetical protein
MRFLSGVTSELDPNSKYYFASTLVWRMPDPLVRFLTKVKKDGPNLGAIPEETLKPH